MFASLIRMSLMIIALYGVIGSGNAVASKATNCKLGYMFDTANKY